MLNPLSTPGPYRGPTEDERQRLLAAGWVPVLIKCSGTPSWQLPGTGELVTLETALALLGPAPKEEPDAQAR